ncbi:MAG: DNA primase [Candidatus Niyogibacteria bacterium]|nr:DNA primase [Candidatus Niyogibacteria bacterium]
MSSSVEQIKSRLDLVDVIQSYIKVHRAGANFKANCPFHNEKTPSFFISPAREIWHCFGCGKGGDLIKFVMEIEGAEFPEALRILANRAGIVLETEDPRARDERTRAFELLEDATAFFEVESARHPEIAKYLSERGLAAGTIKDFRIGYAPASWDGTLLFLKNKGYADAEIERAGLAIKSSKNESGYYDRFRGRVMFPISDSTGRVVGFSGRIFSPVAKQGGEEEAKYINSPQTLLYDKSKILYGFDRAKVEIRKENTCILVEGQMDAVMSHQAGIKNAVAVSGTALTNYQLTMIKRLADNLITAFDMDVAGGLATKRGIDLALGEGFEVKVAVISGGKDPADLVKEDAALWQKSVASARHILDFYLDMLYIKYKNDAREMRKKTGELVLPYIAGIQSEIDKAHWVGEVAKRLNLSEQPIWDEVKKYKNNNFEKPFASQAMPAGRQAGVKESEKTRKHLLEEKILGLAVWNNALIVKAMEGRDDRVFSDAAKPLIVKVMAGLPAVAGDGIDPVKSPHGGSAESAFNRVDMGEHKDYLDRLALEAELFYANTDKDLAMEASELIDGLEREHVKERLVSLAGRIREAESNRDNKMLDALAMEFGELSKKLI